MAWCSVKHRDSFTFTFFLHVSCYRKVTGLYRPDGSQVI